MRGVRGKPITPHVYSLTMHSSGSSSNAMQAKQSRNISMLRWALVRVFLSYFYDKRGMLALLLLLLRGGKTRCRHCALVLLNLT